MEKSIFEKKEKAYKMASAREKVRTLMTTKSFLKRIVKKEKFLILLIV